MGFLSGMCSSSARLDGKTAIITGCNTGIGKETARDFFARGARVIMACRNKQKATEAIKDIISSCISTSKNLGQLIIEELDLSSLKSVRKCAKNILEKEFRIDLLVNNAGIVAWSEARTQDGFEAQFGTNHLGHFLFTLLLLPKIIQSAPARIVNVSSIAHSKGAIDFDDLNWTKKSYTYLKAYGSSKLANILFTKELARRLKEANINNVTVYSLHPGVIRTDISRDLDKTYGFLMPCLWSLCGWVFKSPEQGAQTTIYCAVDEKCANESGLYYAECAVKRPASLATDMEVAGRLWRESLKLVNLSENYDPLVNVQTID